MERSNGQFHEKKSACSMEDSQKISTAELLSAIVPCFVFKFYSLPFLFFHYQLDDDRLCALNRKIVGNDQYSLK